MIFSVKKKTMYEIQRNNRIYNEIQKQVGLQGKVREECTF